MKKHAKSLLFSLFIHTLLLIAVFYIYETLKQNFFHKTLVEKKRVCISLGKLISQSQIKKHKSVIKHKKKHQKEKKVLKKHVIQKKAVVKKNIKKAIAPIKKVLPVKKKVVKQEVQKVVSKLNKVKEDVLPSKVTKDIHKEENCPLACCVHPSKEKMYKEKNLAKIAQLLQENLYYPRRARKRGIEGEVIVSFTLTKDAKVTAIKVLSSQSDILSRAAKKTLEELSGEFPKPDEKLTLTVPITYNLK